MRLLRKREKYRKIILQLTIAKLVQVRNVTSNCIAMTRVVVGHVSWPLFAPIPIRRVTFSIFKSRNHILG